ncbi:MAG: EAL domain-containing protein [Acidobacteria bacterium]|nr:EAL domain-containing protein [Acidobacteriota bacterium]
MRRSAPEPRFSRYAEERLRIALIWGVAIAGLMTGARARLLEGGLTHPLSVGGVAVLLALMALYIRITRQPLSERWRAPVTFGVALTLISLLGARSVADDILPAGDSMLRLGPALGLLWSAQLMLPWRLFGVVVAFGGGLAALPFLGPTPPPSPLGTITVAALIGALVVRWAAVRDVRSREEAHNRESNIQRDLVRTVRKLRESELKARRSSALIEKVTAGMPLGVVVHDPDSDEIVYSNGRCAEIWGYDPEPAGSTYTPSASFQTTMERALGMMIDPQPFLEMQGGLRQDRSNTVSEVELELRDGRTLRYFSVFIHDEAGRDFGRLHAVEDITSRKRAEETEVRYGLAARCANDGLVDWDLRARRVHYSDRWKEMLGYAPDELDDTPREAISRIHPKDRDHVLRTLFAHLRGGTERFECEFRMRTRRGEYLWMLGRGLALRGADGRAYRMAGSQTDITQRKLAEMRLRHDAEHDSLTALANRSRFHAELSARLAELRRGEIPPFAVMFLDVDRFKVVNDSIGHAAGDELLVSLARRLRDAVPPSSEVARLGGDEFALLLRDVISEEAALEAARNLQRRLAEPIQLRGQEMAFSSSIGIVWAERRYRAPEDVLRDADAAMYRAKEQGGGSAAIFRAEMHASALRTLEVQSALQKAIDRDELSIVWQPIYSCRRLEVIGVEALLRWNNPRLGPLGPAEFIPIAEEIGYVDRLDAWVLSRACSQMAAWRHEGATGMQLSVNLSARGLTTAGLAERLRKTVEAAGLVPWLVTLELTETGLVENLDSAGEALQQLSQLGFHIALDDFGTGYSSLNYIRRLPIDVLKIAGSLADDVCRDPRSGAVTTLVIETAHALGLKVVSERVEHEEQLAFLRERSCDAAQGFHLSPPLPVDQMTELLRHGPRRSPQGAPLVEQSSLR